MLWRGRILTGALAHWCFDWDFLPVDETTIEIESCHCFSAEEKAPVQTVIDATILRLPHERSHRPRVNLEGLTRPPSIEFG